MQGEEKKRKDMQVPRDQNFDALLSWWILGSLGVEGQVGWWWCCSTGSGKGGMEEMYVLWCTRDPASFRCHSCFVIRNQKEGWFNLGILEFSGFPQTSSKCMVPRSFEGFPPQKKTVPWLRLGVANQPGGHRQAEWLEYGSQTHRGDEPNMDFSGESCPDLPDLSGPIWCIWKLGDR